METRILEDDQAVARAGAAIVAEWIRTSPNRTVVPAMGSTPQGLYRQLEQQRAADGLPEIDRVTVIQLDEYVGIPDDDRRSLHGWLHRSFAVPLAIPAERVIRLDGDATDLAAVCRDYDAAVAAAGGVDIAVLGLGPNGHLGFNEPPSPADAPTREVALTDESVRSNAAYWDGGEAAVPRRALTMGMPWLLAARNVLLVVTGERKRAILRRVLEGPIGPEVPASYLRDHPGAVLLADQAAWPAGR